MGLYSLLRGTLTLFQTEIYVFRYSISDVTQKFIYDFIPLKLVGMISNLRHTFDRVLMLMEKEQFLPIPGHMAKHTLFQTIILYFPIPHNSLCPPPPPNFA